MPVVTNAGMNTGVQITEFLLFGFLKYIFIWGFVSVPSSGLCKLFGVLSSRSFQFGWERARGFHNYCPEEWGTVT